MAKVRKVQHKTRSNHHMRTPVTCNSSMAFKAAKHKKKGSKALEKKQWKSCTCSVCMEYPHNAVLLLCSSYNKGCRPYMCATSHRYSNCLEQYKKAYSKVVLNQAAETSIGPADTSGFHVGSDCFGEKMVKSELLCPLCRGQVKGWTVVEPARKYLNTKRRTCMKDKCSFVGTYKELRKHVRAEHPCARPREVDPTLVEKWNRLEEETEREDVISTIQSSTPGALVLGDYVIETNYLGFLGDYNVDDYLGETIVEIDSEDSSDYGYDSLDEEDDSVDEEDGARDDGTLAASNHVNGNYESLFSRNHSSFLSRRLIWGPRGR